MTDRNTRWLYYLQQEHAQLPAGLPHRLYISLESRQETNRKGTVESLEKRLTALEEPEIIAQGYGCRGYNKVKGDKTTYTHEYSLPSDTSLTVIVTKDGAVINNGDCDILTITGQKVDVDDWWGWGSG